MMSAYDTQLYIFLIDENQEFLPCPGCGGDLSCLVSGSEESMLLICNSCDYKVNKDESEEYFKRITAGKAVKVKPVAGDGYRFITDFYPGDPFPEKYWDALLRRNTGIE